MCLYLSLQEAENTLRMTQHKLREEERALMRSSCETNYHSSLFMYLLICFTFNSQNVCSAVKDEDWDLDVLVDEGSDSDMEESRPSNPRPTRNGIMAGKQNVLRTKCYNLKIKYAFPLYCLGRKCLLLHKLSVFFCFSFRKRSQIHREHAGW